MQTIRQSILNQTRTILPLRRVICPVRTVCDVRPCANISKPCHQGIEITIKPIKMIHRPRNHVGTKHTIGNQCGVDVGQHVIVILVQGLPKIRNAGNLPQQSHRLCIACHPHNIGARRQCRQCLMVKRIAFAKQKRQRRRGFERGQQRIDRGKIKLAVAPVH